MTPILVFIGVVNEMLTWQVCCTRWGLGSPSPLRGFAIQTVGIFITVCYLKYTDFLSQDICFWVGLKSIISPGDSKYEGWTKNLQRNVAFSAPAQPEFNEWPRESGGTRILKPGARDGGIYGCDE